MKASLLYYSHDQLPEPLRNCCLANIIAIDNFEELIVVVPPGRGYEFADVIRRASAEIEKPIRARMIETEGKPGHHDITVKTLAGLEKVETDVVYLLEHDVLYPKDYLRTRGGNNRGQHVWFNINNYSANDDGYLINSSRTLTSNAFGRVEVFWEIYTRRLANIAKGERIKWGEPSRNPGDGPFTPATISAPSPVIDVRWGGNYTGHRAGATTQTLPYWGDHKALWAYLKLNGVTP